MKPDENKQSSTGAEWGTKSHRENFDRPGPLSAHNRPTTSPTTFYHIPTTQTTLMSPVAATEYFFRVNYGGANPHSGRAKNH